VLFKSVAEAGRWSGILAIVLTGMGRDGVEGVARLKQKQECFCIAQNEETCVVYGMPRVAVERGLADMVLGLGDIAREMESFTYD
jgi:two-component system chemotaxis response regulator CheB